MGKITETFKLVKKGAKAVKKAVDKNKGKPKAKEKIPPPLTAAQNRARIAKIREKEAPARARLQRIKDKAEARRDEADDISASDPGPKLTGVEKFNAKKMGVNTKGKTPDEVRFDTREKLIEKEISAEKSAYEPRFNKKGGIIKKKKKKVVKLKVGGALADYYKGMM